MAWKGWNQHFGYDYGLGNVKQEWKKVKQELPQGGTSQLQGLTPSEYRAYCIQGVLSFLQSPLEETVLALPVASAKKEWRFIPVAILAFNNRTNLGVPSREEKELADIVHKQMMRNLQLKIRFELAKNKRELYLAKVTKTYVRPRKRRRYTPVNNDNTKNDDAHTQGLTAKDPVNNDNTKNDDAHTQGLTAKDPVNNDNTKNDDAHTQGLTAKDPVNNDNTKNDDAHTQGLTAKAKLPACATKTQGLTAKAKLPACATKRLSKIITQRLKWLRSIKKFLTDGKIDSVLEFCSKKNKTHDYVRQVINNINRGTMNDIYSDIEIDLVCGLQKLAKNFYITLRQEKRILTLTKNSKRTTSSSAIPPPLIYEDVKNTGEEMPDIKPHLKIDGSVAKIDEKTDSVSNNEPKHIKLEENANDNLTIKQEKDVSNNDPDLANPSHCVRSQENSDINDCDNVVIKVEKTEDLDRPNDHDLINSIKSESTTETNLENCTSMNVSNSLHVKTEVPDDEYKDNQSRSELNTVHNIKEEHEDNITDYGFNSVPAKRNNPTNEQVSHKRTKFVKYAIICSKDGKEMGLDSIKLVQKKISDAIDEKVFLPLLQCHGIHDGGLLYSCHNEDTYNWLKNVINVDSDVKLKETDYYENIFKLGLKLTSFIEEDIKTILSRLEMYNSGLSTQKWTILDKQIIENYVHYNVEVDENSFKFIKDKNFSLYAGTDKAQFYVL